MCHRTFVFIFICFQYALWFSALLAYQSVSAHLRYPPLLRQSSIAENIIPSTKGRGTSGKDSAVSFLHLFDPTFTQSCFALFFFLYLADHFFFISGSD
jgi:hypothetical protein